MRPPPSRCPSQSTTGVAGGLRKPPYASDFHVYLWTLHLVLRNKPILYRYSTTHDSAFFGKLGRQLLALPLISESVHCEDFEPPVIQEAIDGLKVSECLPETILRRQLGRRTNNLAAVAAVLTEAVHAVCMTES